MKHLVVVSVILVLGLGCLIFLVPSPGSDDKEFIITFPTNDAKWETAWKITR